MNPEVPDQKCQETLRDLLLGLPGVREGKMFGVPAFYVGRRLFACVYGDVAGVKVPEDLAQRLLDDSRFAPFQPRGRHKMREWVQFPCAPHEHIEDYQDVLLASYEFVGSSSEG
jgi:hypothetical protein